MKASSTLCPMLLKWIGEVADEPLVLDPDDQQAETRVNTWSLSATPTDLSTLTVDQVVSAFEQTAAALRRRVHDMGHKGTATFYVWHDQQAGQLRCSTSTQTPSHLPFGGTYEPTDALAPIVEEFLNDKEPGMIPWADLDTVGDDDAEPDDDPIPPQFPVWTLNIGSGGQAG